MRQEVAFLPRRAKAKGKRKPYGFATEGIDVVWKEEGRNETSPENDYTNNEASVPIAISGMSVRVLNDTEVESECSGASDYM